MRVLESWLKDYVSYSLAPVVLADRLSMLGLEIEGVENLGQRYKGFVVGKILQKDNHPHADRLSVCMVSVGKEKLQIVCGDPNVAVGQKVAVGLAGATVPRHQHDASGKPFVLSHTKIRGIESLGMICSAYELDLGSDADGVLVLDKDARVGQSLSSYLGLDDIAYDVEITANRPDWMSHFGVAREIAVVTGKSAKLPPIKLKEVRTPLRRFLSVRVEDKNNCVRFSARMIRGISLGPSPKWMQQRLLHTGLRPRNIVVDATNYVMLECGQPLHAFDYRLLKGSMITVRQTGAEKEFVTLDGKVHLLPADAVMVCDAEREVSIAGIMGGRNSEIQEDTQDIVLESANWNSSSIRKTRKALCISTEASQRFERGADPNATLYALNRAAALILQYAGGELLSGTIDICTKKIRPKEIPLRTERTNAVLGTSLSSAQIRRYLARLGMNPSTRKRESFMVPSFRIDVEREIDLIEEVARVHGYDNIAMQTSSRIDFTHPFVETDRATLIRRTLVGMGYHEAISYSLQSLAKAQLAGSAPISVRNPTTQEMTALRTSLVPGLLEAVAMNRNHGNENIRLFEIGHVFRRNLVGAGSFVENFLEQQRFCMLLAGLAAPRHWSAPARMVDIYDLKGDVEAVLEEIALDKGRFISYSTTETLAENPLTIEINGVGVGYFGKVARNILDQFGIEGDVFLADFDAELLPGRSKRKLSALPKFPKVLRDVAFVVDKEIPAGRIEVAICRAASPLMRSLSLFDVYEGEKLSSSKKSLAFTIELMSFDRTLTDNEVEREINGIIDAVTQEFGATLRAS